ncbi:uncharacterized protein LOC116777908 [Danaus plexippus]|uniref:uncharacterized protein LOC116777908 n=1 Tax=Danaus plexippus TaxID=13037 RepID=UPI002AB00321|nr:uncharacterized protein LOC116777908 [Danaus plexippus]XP_061385812.1 uncharacterized protein LOC116777908 [Danaus plexippus]
MDTPNSLELDFTEHWGNNIHEEVLRGKEVRSEKVKNNSTNSIYDYGFANLDFDKPSCSKYRKTNIPRKGTSEDELYFLHVRKKRNKKGRKIKPSKGTRKCQMRIAELAVPSKRYCIETWRSKWDTLPIHMVDRLRQIVLDQKPIVPIDDAIRCFKQYKRINTRPPCKRNVPENKEMERIKLLCAMFGYQIIARLLPPRNLTLSSRLTPISYIINDEVSFLCQKNKLSKLQDVVIQKEIVNKITNWIADVIEQSDYNLMMEDYRELEKEEGHIWDIIDEIVNNAILLCKEPSVSSSSVGAKSSDSCIYYSNEDDGTPSERHSGDENVDESGNIISDIIENIINVHDYKPRDEIEALHISMDDNLDDTGDADRKISSGSLERDIKDFLLKYIENDQSELVKSGHLESTDPSVIDNRMDNIVANDFNETDQENVRIIEKNTNDDIKETGTDLTELTSDDKGPTNNAFNDVQKNESDHNNSIENSQEGRNAMKHNFDVENDNKVINVPSKQGQANGMNVILSQDKLDAIKIDNKDSGVANNLTTIENNLVNTKDSEGKSPFKNATSEDSLKKVKFSNINIDSGHRQLNDSGFNGQNENNIQKKINVHLAPPNNNLLSDVDEPWPENLIFPLVKATVSVSKSILSLGKIMEVEEKINDSRINSNMEDDTEVEENSDETKNVITLRSLNKVADKLNKENVTSTDKEIQCELNRENRNVGTDIDRIRRIRCDMLSETRLSGIEIRPEIIIHQKPSRDVAKKDKTTEIKSSGTKYSIPTNNPFIDYQSRENGIRIWCKGLYNVTENLDMWLDWLNNSCSHILYLHQKAKITPYEQNKQSYNQQWINLRVNIDSDARLWNKLHTSLKIGLKSYKQYYKRPEIQLTRSYRSHQPQRKEQQYQTERICTCTPALRVPLDPRAVHL